MVVTVQHISVTTMAHESDVRALSFCYYFHCDVHIAVTLILTATALSIVSTATLLYTVMLQCVVVIVVAMLSVLHR